MKAIKLSPLSLSIPFLSFTHVFMILTGLIVLNEVPSGWGVIGIGFVVAGSYILRVTRIKYGYLSPFQRIRYWYQDVRGSIDAYDDAAFYESVRY